MFTRRLVSSRCQVLNARLPQLRHRSRRTLGSVHCCKALRRQLGIERLEPRIVLSFDPTGIEQELLQLVNRLRTDPQGELTRLVDRLNPISSPEQYILQELQYWGVSGDTLVKQWTNLTPVPPLAWSETLYDSAHAHNMAMIHYDDQQHQFPGEADPGQRMRDAGYNWRRWGENIYAYPRSIYKAHGGFVIDWGIGPGGIQDPPSHRQHLLDASLQHIGIAVAEIGSNPNRNVGPLVVTQDIAQPMVADAPYIVGSVFKQTGSSLTYHAGNGYGQVTLTFTGSAGTFQATTMSAGGYQLQLPPGTYRGVATGDDLPAPLISAEFVVGTDNVAVDFKYPQDQSALPVANGDVVATNLNTAIVVDVIANDDIPAGLGDSGFVTISSVPSHGQLMPKGTNPGEFSYVPEQDYRGIDQFQYTVTDGNAITSRTATVRVLVLDYQDHPWHNPWTAVDVNGDGTVSPYDVLLVISDLNRDGSRLLPVPPGETTVPPLLDVSRDDTVSPIDALLIINQLNTAGSSEGEDDSPPMDMPVELLQATIPVACFPPSAAATPLIIARDSVRRDWSAASMPLSENLGRIEIATEPPIVDRGARRVRSGADLEAELAHDLLWAQWPRAWEPWWL